MKNRDMSLQQIHVPIFIILNPQLVKELRRVSLDHREVARQVQLLLVNRQDLGIPVPVFELSLIHI